MNNVKYKEIALELENNVKNNIYREKLPPVRSLVAEFGVANPTMNKALKILVKKGLIIPSGPQGNIISRKKVIRPKTKIVAIFYSSINRAISDDLMLQELKLQVEDAGYKPLFMNAPSPNSFDDEEFWSSNWVDGYIFAYSSIKKELAYRLQRKGVPFVTANRLPPECGAHWVDFNLEKTLRILLQALIQAGRQQVMFAYSRRHLSSYDSYMMQIWNEVMKEYSRKCSGTLLYFGDNDVQKNSIECAKKFAECNADALISIGLSPLVIESELAITGRQISKDYSLIYRSSKVICPVEKFPCVIIPYNTLAGQAWNLLKRVIENPELPVQNILVDDNIYIDQIIKRRYNNDVKPTVRSTTYAITEV